MKKAFESFIVETMKENTSIILLLGDSDFAYYDDIKELFPLRHINFGISECSMVAAAAAVAKDGWIPVVYTTGAFLAYRAYEFIRNDVCLQNLNVKLVGMGAGLKINNFGPTHHTTEDIAALRALPNLAIASPASPREVIAVCNAMINRTGPTYLRLGKAFEKEIFDNNPVFQFGESMPINRGSDLTIFATGSIITNALEATKQLASLNYNAEVINVSSLKPLDTNTIIQAALKTKRIITVEEHQISGGLGSCICEILMEHSENAAEIRLKRIGLYDKFCTEYGWHKDLLEAHGLSPEQIFASCLEILGER